MSGIYGIPDTFPEEPQPEAIPSEVTVSTRHRRPDRDTVVKRDSVVLELVQRAGSQGISRTAVAQELGLTMHEAYLSLNRVQHTGRIKNTRRNNAHIWIAQGKHTEGA